MDQPLHVGIATCDHKVLLRGPPTLHASPAARSVSRTSAALQVCYGCAYQLCSRGLSPPICPFCRGPIKTFVTSTSVDKRDAPAAPKRGAPPADKGL